MDCELCSELARLFPWQIVQHNGVPLQEGPLLEVESVLAVTHGPFEKQIKKRRILGNRDDVFVQSHGFNAVGQMSRWRHLLRFIVAFETDGGTCCVCLHDRSNLIGCPQCTATICFGCVVRMGTFDHHRGWVCSCPQCRDPVLATAQDTPLCYIPWFYRCNGSYRSRLIRGLALGLVLQSLKTGQQNHGVYTFNFAKDVADNLVHGRCVRKIFLEHDSLPAKRDSFIVRCRDSTSGETTLWEECVPSNLHSLFGKRGLIQ